ncbi:DUF1353 domain-containing protein [Bradyrhizobium sp. CB82]|uniref:DUF1353 domain-containing protein n=1 Tax=Bradyrhizobium sp. CB82 TaxID=3039159 RepID=UPI0024B0823A|nr:DUF1353 domain-containing protein [Bradyrhizobium sp. CB82]WFU41815.1 DUF1353 domain-containing protein [Bradyrhizobium sp. CB82]
MMGRFSELSLALVGLLALAHAAQAAVLPDPLPCGPCFIGSLLLLPNGSDPTGKTKVLGEDIYFVDPDKFVWKAGKGDVTDGASIPDLFQPIVGGPFEVDYLPAAVIHDHYTDRNHRVRTWRDTARVFYQAMLVNGVNIVKAKTMYFAVYAFGPHWGFLAQGVPCGHNCVFTVPLRVSTSGKGDVIATGVEAALPEGRVYAEQVSDFSASHSDELKDIQKKIELSELRGAPLSLKDLEVIATLSHGDNVFLASE